MQRKVFDENRLRNQRICAIPLATHATKIGVDPKTLSGILGHTNVSFTLDRYSHVTGDMRKNASATVEKMMQKMMIKEPTINKSRGK